MKSIPRRLKHIVLNKKFAVVATVGGSLGAVRQWAKLQSADHHIANADYRNHTHFPLKPHDFGDLYLWVSRLRLMQQVCPEVESIRNWHQNHRFYGGIVLRHLDIPRKKYTEKPWTGVSEKEKRECYYLYYELAPDGTRSIHLFVRGTSHIEDMFTNFKYGTEYDQELGCHVHKGFKQQAEILLADIEPFLLQSHGITCCGHSLGGAVAQIAAMKLHARGYKVDRLITFAQPKCISDRGCEDWESKIDVLRVVHPNDPCTPLPPSTLFHFQLIN